MYYCLKKFLKNKTGATAIEYGLIVALIGISTIAAVRNTGTSMQGTLNTVSDALSGNFVAVAEMVPDMTFSTGEAGISTGNRLVDPEFVANAKDFEPHDLIDGLNSQDDLHRWMDSDNYFYTDDNDLTRPSRVHNFLSDMSTIYGTDMTQDLSSYGSWVSKEEFNQIMDDFNEKRVTL